MVTQGAAAPAGAWTGVELVGGRIDGADSEPGFVDGGPPGRRGGAGASVVPRGRVRMQPCEIQGLPDVDTSCVTLAAPGGLKGPEGHNDIALRVVWVPGLNVRPGTPPLFLLAGGPGQGAIESFPPLLGARGDLRRGQDVVLMDQRGTGESTPLSCLGTGGESDKSGSAGKSLAERLAQAGDLSLAREEASRCLHHLGHHYDLTRFSTADAAHDIERVRMALGLDSIDIMAASYGTRLALRYISFYGSRVRAAVLDGVAPPEMLLPLTMPVDAVAALDRVLADCHQDDLCRKAFPQLPRRAEDLNFEPMRNARVRDPSKGDMSSVEISRAMILGKHSRRAIQRGHPGLVAHGLECRAGGRLCCFGGHWGCVCRRC